MKQNQKLNDSRMAAEIASAIQVITTVPTESIVVSAREGWVWLAGTLKERHQKEVVEDVVRNLAGVRGITNMITIDPRSRGRNDRQLAVSR